MRLRSLRPPPRASPQPPFSGGGFWDCSGLPRKAEFVEAPSSQTKGYGGSEGGKWRPRRTSSLGRALQNARRTMRPPARVRRPLCARGRRLARVPLRRAQTRDLTYLGGGRPRADRGGQAPTSRRHLRRCRPCSRGLLTPPCADRRARGQRHCHRHLHKRHYFCSRHPRPADSQRCVCKLRQHQLAGATPLFFPTTQRPRGTRGALLAAAANVGSMCGPRQRAGRGCTLRSWCSCY